MKVWLKIHRWLGALLAPIMVVWFLSGIGMIFFSFPKLGNKDIPLRDNIEGSLPAPEALLEQIPEGEEVKSLTLTTYGGTPIFSFTTDQGDYSITADTLFTPVEQSGVSRSYLLAQAERWSTYPIREVKELYRLDWWIPYSQMKEHFPIYRIEFDDPDKSYLYLSSHTGEALQFCTRSERIEGALSTIPHMLYFYQLRAHKDVWSAVVTLFAALSVIMCLAGMVIGIGYLVMVYRRRGKLGSPYQREVYRLHHIIGLIFGFLAMMFALSGMMLINDLPSWMVKEHNTRIKRAVRRSDSVDLGKFAYDYRELMSLGDVKEIRFEQYGDTPYYTVIYRDTVEKYRAVGEGLTPLYLTETEVLSKLSRIVSEPLEVDVMSAFDNYYVSMDDRLELPVYRVTARDADHSVFYVNPKSGSTRYYNTNSRVKKWIYPTFHSLRVKYFATRPTLRVAIVLIAALGGLVLSVTGFMISFRFWRRHILGRRARRKKAG